MGIGERQLVNVAAIVAMFLVLNLTRGHYSPWRWVLIFGSGLAVYVISSAWRRR